MPIRRWLGKFDDGKFQTLRRMKDSGEFYSGQKPQAKISQAKNLRPKFLMRKIKKNYSGQNFSCGK